MPAKAGAPSTRCAASRRTAFWVPSFAGMTVLFVAAFAQAAAPLSREAQVAAVIARYANQPPQLRALLQTMPKGGDLHNHLDGSVYAEDFLKWASEDAFCVARTTRALTPPPCTADQVSATGLAERDPVFYQATIDALSMRNWSPGSGTGEWSGHDHTFATFGRFIPVGSRHLGDMLAATRLIAAADHVNYIEQMTDPGAAFSPELFADSIPFNANDFEKSYAAIAPKLPALVAAARAEYDAAEAKMRAQLRCSAVALPPACAVKVHYLYYVVRTLPPKLVFAQMALGYALTLADQRFVGMNFVAPEDDAVALRDFKLHMQMFASFHAKYPRVRLALHAGELTLGLVPRAELGFHIRDSVEIAGANRIGHGYAIEFENDLPSLLREMAQKKVAVEINLTSNQITAGIPVVENPMALYRQAGVPVTLSADDEGVFRIDLTHEYVRAVTEQKLGYRDLKELARNGLEYSFVPGDSLWIGGNQAKINLACAGNVPGAKQPSALCAAFLARSEKAMMQWDFEADIAEYENAVLAGPFARH
ncbi:MAG: adenosine deaminase [Alphaproteobacteria bacterium]|nr:adenosine deaminase [Alphaproteobacteria bacterium]MBL6939972.1 adenosine deaminase [Alphaproteobacteria bacterium]MBL7098172.1 adenosine deaminase [Alphaproteobacteria bacterium]